MPSELELARARKAMDAAREEIDAVNANLNAERIAKAKAFRKAEAEYKELCKQVEEA